MPMSVGIREVRLIRLDYPRLILVVTTQGELILSTIEETPHLRFAFTIPEEPR